MTKKYIIINTGKFHHFELAKAIHKKNQLIKIICGYPWIKLKKEGLSKKYVECVNLISIVFHLALRCKLYFILNFLNKIIHKIIEKKHLKHLDKCNIIIGLSGSLYKSVDHIKKKNIFYICERASAHIEFQNKILREEYKINNLYYKPIPSWIIKRELYEYEKSDFILTPSNFAKKTFIEKGFHKIEKINFPVNTERFYHIKKSIDNKKFVITFLGQISLQKGFHYLLKAFKEFKHPKKELQVIGLHTSDKKFFLDIIKKERIDNIIFKNHIPNTELKYFLNKSDCFVLPSIQDGYAISVIQAIACGIPVIVTKNTGAEEYVLKNNCGFVVNIRSSKEILLHLNKLKDDEKLRNQLSENCLESISKFTWDNYLDELDTIINKYKN